MSSAEPRYAFFGFHRFTRHWRAIGCCLTLLRQQLRVLDLNQPALQVVGDIPVFPRHPAERPAHVRIIQRLCEAPCPRRMIAVVISRGPSPIALATCPLRHAASTKLTVCMISAARMGLYSVRPKRIAPAFAASRA